ncbi:DUF1007 family protein [Halarcobacter sp.]|uniref:DUF1007 family protein n=1 Tax=Halarcobacter sp. TaxID=2321133 RepID=UPI002AABCC39|nr:DUF1007 family protein [Halarcobacter sp.]
MKLVLLCIVFLLFSNSVYAHPHTFIEVKPTLEIKNEQINKINIRWILDEMTSMMLIMELDENSNGIFEKEENDFIFENYFLSLSSYNFYMHLSINDKEIKFKPKNFQASIENNKLIYSFDIVQNIDLKNLKIEFFDEELFVGMILEKNFISFSGLQANKAEKLKKKIFGVS